MAIAIALFILLLETFLTFGGISVLVLGQSLTTLFKRKSPFTHFRKMFIAIYRIAPMKTLNRLSWALIVGFGIFSMLFDTVQKDPSLDLNFDGSTLFFVIGIYNLILFIFSIITLIISKKKRNIEQDWATVRMKSHRTVYGCYPKYNEYATW